ncbi:glycosyltransferase [Mucilaginibacter rubeus]|uniref:Glycosyltransferase n=1 Tax=Mucilaginibacter rubeus TaxID=2027860 RepID=A0A5C1HXE8_9SPHI|nr:glycosyltransferase [Mucilaginibacter rubeus]QEM10532.1 glycosyltransferase [Mucilaginibacter rubeus]
MRIAFILSTCEPSGPFIVAKDIINNIVGEHDVTIYYLKESVAKLDFKAPIHKVDLFTKTDFSSYDVVHSHGFLGDFYSFFNRKTIKKRIATLHQEIRPVYSFRYNQFIGIATEKVWFQFIKKANCIVTLSKLMADTYKRALPKSAISFVHNGTSPNPSALVFNEEVDALNKLKQQYKIIGVSSRLVYGKGIDQLIQALAIDEERKFGLLLIGDGDKRLELMDLAKKLNVNDRCLFLGYKPNAIDYFKYFDLYGMTSMSEGFGLCVIEAASQKIPVVCSDLPVFRELFDSDEVMTYQLGNINSLLATLVETDRNKEVLAKKIYSKYSKCYTAQIMAANYIKLYNR